jgi:hypothetical protein
MRIPARQQAMLGFLAWRLARRLLRKRGPSRARLAAVGAAGLVLGLVGGVVLGRRLSGPAE